MNDLKAQSKEVISTIQDILKQAEGNVTCNDQAELALGCKYEHSFTDGMYIRKMFIPKDLIITTFVHKFEHPYFIMYGDVSVFADGELWRIKAPYAGITKPGTQRALRTHQDTLWITVHKTDKTTVEEAVREVACETMEEYEEWIKNGGVL